MPPAINQDSFNVAYKPTQKRFKHALTGLKGHDWIPASPKRIRVCLKIPACAVETSFTLAGKFQGFEFTGTTVAARSRQVQVPVRAVRSSSQVVLNVPRSRLYN